MLFMNKNKISGGHTMSTQQKRRPRVDVTRISELRNKIYLNEEEVAAITGKAVSTLRNDRFLRRGIPYLKDNKRVMYRNPDVFNHMERHYITFNAEMKE
jgi:hypothetical protein